MANGQASGHGRGWSGCAMPPSMSDVGAESGPREVDASSWDGLSIWIGRLPKSAIVQRGTGERQ